VGSPARPGVGRSRPAPARCVGGVPGCRREFARRNSRSRPGRVIGSRASLISPRTNIATTTATWPGSSSWPCNRQTTPVRTTPISDAEDVVQAVDLTRADRDVIALADAIRERHREVIRRLAEQTDRRHIDAQGRWRSRHRDPRPARDVLAAIDANARRAGLWRSEYVRRLLTRERRGTAARVSVGGLERIAERLSDLNDAELMRRGWRFRAVQSWAMCRRARGRPASHGRGARCPRRRGDRCVRRAWPSGRS
jgi:hypothetical protein